MPSVDLRALKAAVSVPRALSLLGWKAKCWNSTRHRGPCVIHASRPGSRIMSVTHSHWYCHKCKVGGDVLDLWMRVRGIYEIVALAVDLCAQAGLDVPYQRFRRPRQPRQPRIREEAR